MGAKYPAMSVARLKMLKERGQLYAARSRYCDWIKIGFTSKSAQHRLEAAASQYPEFAPFTLMGSTLSIWDAEQQLHRTLAPFRQRQKGRTIELYPAVPSLVSAIEQILLNREWLPLNWQANREVREWAYRVAAHPTNRDEALEAFERFRHERSAA